MANHHSQGKKQRKRPSTKALTPNPWGQLPFVDQSQKSPHWKFDPPVVSDYEWATDVGYQYFWDIYHFLKANPDASILYHICEHMYRIGRGKNGCMHGYAVGFFYELERFIVKAEIRVTIQNAGIVFDREGQIERSSET